jgi:hypothetical protein
MDENSSLDPARDPYSPPAKPTVVSCIHCGEEFDSNRIQWRIDADADGKPHGYWCCPTPQCNGMGFGFDIWPVDPAYQDERGIRGFADDNESEEYPPEIREGAESAVEDHFPEDDGRLLPW